MQHAASHTATVQPSSQRNTVITLYVTNYLQQTFGLWGVSDPWCHSFVAQLFCLYTQTRTHMFNSAFPGLSRWTGTRKVKPIWILLKHETVSGSGTSWAICKSASRSRQITTLAPQCSVFYRPDALPATQPTASKHGRQICTHRCQHPY